MKSRLKVVLIVRFTWFERSSFETLVGWLVMLRMGYLLSSLVVLLLAERLMVLLRKAI